MKEPIILVEKDVLQTIKVAGLDKERSKEMKYASVSKPYNKHYQEENLDFEIPEKTIYEVLRDNNENNKEGGLFYAGNNIDFPQMFEEIDKVAKGLQKAGLKKGDTIAAALTSTPESVYLLYAASRLGITFASIDPRDSIKEIQKKLFFGTRILIFNI